MIVQNIGNNCANCPLQERGGQCQKIRAMIDAAGAARANKDEKRHSQILTSAADYCLKHARKVRAV